MTIQYEGISYDMGMGAAKLSGRQGDITLPAHVALYDGNKVTADDLPPPQGPSGRRVGRLRTSGHLGLLVGEARGVGPAQ